MTMPMSHCRWRCPGCTNWRCPLGTVILLLPQSYDLFSVPAALVLSTPLRSHLNGGKVRVIFLLRTDENCPVSDA